MVVKKINNGNIILEFSMIKPKMLFGISTVTEKLSFSQNGNLHIKVA